MGKISVENKPIHQLILRTHPNTVLFTRQGIREGSIGIAPPEVDQSVVTENMPMMSVNTDMIEVAYLKKLLLSKYLREKVRLLLVVGSAQKSIHERDFLNIELEIPNIKIQREKCKRLYVLIQKHFELKQELTHQQALLKKLRQQILQEAIEGKLTADWREKNPDVEPAGALLKRIQAEKAQLIKDKKIKKQKPLPPIGRKEKPFDLPEGWEWCRVVDIGRAVGGITKNSSKNSTKNFLPYLRVANVYADKIRLDEVKTIGVSDNELEKLLLVKDDLLIVEGNGSYDQIGRIAIWDGSIDPCIHQNHLIRLRPLDTEVSFWLLRWFLSPSGRKLIEKEARTSTGLYNLSTGKINKLLVALPPLPEQKAIVAKVEKLLAICDQLETQITANQAHAEQLMQAVLKETFQQNNSKPATRPRSD